MGILKKPSAAWEREFRAAWRQEQRFFQQYERETVSPLRRKLEELVPEALRNTLHTAFCKSFAVVFEKGTGVILRAGRQEERQRACAVRQYAADLKEDRRSLRAFSRAAESAGRGNVLLSGAAGVGMGALGIALPDIPIFTAVLLKSMYETAASFGFACDTAAEKRFLLDLIETALCTGETLRARSRALDGVARTGQWPEGAPTLPEQLDRTARRLSEALLYGKFLQNVPLAGAVGGAGDAVCLRRVQRYAVIRYRKRFLLRRLQVMEEV